MGFEIYKEEFAKIIGLTPKLHCLTSGYKNTEGPVYLSRKSSEEGYFFYTDKFNDRICCIKWYGLSPFNAITTLTYGPVATFRNPAGQSNGMTCDSQGRLVVAEAGGRRITWTEGDGTVVPVVDSYQGKKLNSPNDVVVKSDGTVWFTDPNYGCLGFGISTSPYDAQLPNHVYRYDPKTKEIKPVVESRKNPNGLTFSCDESILYVADSGANQGHGTHYHENPHHVYAYDVNGSALRNERIFAEINPGTPDGMRVDIHDNLYVTTGDGVQVFNSMGELLGKILTPATATNLTFGSKDNNVLFICLEDSVWAIQLNTQGGKKIIEIAT